MWYFWDCSLPQNRLFQETQITPPRMTVPRRTFWGLWSSGKSHRQASGDRILGPRLLHTHCDLGQLLRTLVPSYKIRKWCLICYGGMECLSVSNVWKNLPTRWLHITAFLLIPSFHMFENRLIEEWVLKRLKPTLFVLSIIHEECKNYKTNCSNLTGLRKNTLVPGNTLTPYSESNPRFFLCNFSFLTRPPTSLLCLLCTSQANLPQKQRSLLLKYLPSSTQNSASLQTHEAFLIQEILSFLSFSVPYITLGKL